MRKRILFLLLVVFALLCKSNVYADENITGTLYTLPSNIVNKLLSIKVYRGYGMDKQDIGIYMPAGSSFKIRLKQNTTVTLELLNNNNETEKSEKISTDWVTVTADYDCVPFFKTLHSDTISTIQYEISEQNGTENLTKFTRGNNEANFYNIWSNNNHNYAVITDDYATFLVPRENIEQVGAIVNHNSNLKYPFTSLTDMLNWYDEVIIRFNQYIGLSADAKEDYNKDIRMKYFFKSNISGIGLLAYSPWNYVYTHSSSLEGLLQKGWGAVHEIGHGFQSYFTWSPNENDIRLSEVENNFFAYEEEKKYSNEANGSIGIMYGDRTQLDYVDAIKNLSNFNELMGDGSNSAANADTRLFVFINLFDKIDMPTVMPYTLKKYRSIKASGGSISNVDLYGTYFSEASGYNIIPYLNYFKIYPSTLTKEEVYKNQQPILYPIAQVFNTTTATRIANNLNLRGPYSVVANGDIQNYVSTNNITRDVKFVINTKNSKDLNHKKIYIKNSKDEIIKEEVLSDNEITIKNIPVGMYYIEISNGSISNIDYILISQLNSGNSDLVPIGSSGDSSNETSTDLLTININYTYNPDSVSNEEIVSVPNTGIIESVFIVFGMILIALGIGLIAYKRKELF